MKKRDLDYRTIFQKAQGLFTKHGKLWPIESVWVAILGVFVFVNILVLVWSFILFLRVSGDDVFAITPREEALAETFNRAQLEELLSELRGRQARFETLTQNVVASPVITEDEVSEEEVVVE